MSEKLIYRGLPRVQTSIPVEEMDIFDCEDCFKEYREFSHKQDELKLISLRGELSHITRNI